MIYLFNSSEEVIKIVPSTAIRSFYQTQSLTSEKYISDRVDIELKALPEEILKQIEYVAIPDIQDKYRFHLFFVVRESTEGNITEITGVQSGIEELRKSPVYDIRPQDSPVRLAAERIIQGTNWTVGYAPDDVRVGNMNVYYSSAFEGLKTLCEKTDVEMQFFVEINGNKVGNRYIEFKKKIGKNVGRRVVYGHNALQIIKEVEKTDLVTALVGRGRGEEVSSAEENAGGVAGYGRKITFEDIEWKKANGDPVDKPLGQKYVEIPEMTAIYGVQTPTGKRPKFGFIEFDTDDKAEVLRRTYEALQWVSRPKVEFKTSSVYLKDTYIGDTVRVIRHDRGLAYETRVFEIKIDRISGRCEIKLGDKLSGNDGLSVSKLSSQITNLENSLSQTVQNIVTNLPSADGFTRNWYTDREPSDPRVGDTWFKPDPEHEGHTIMLTWNGEVWEEILRTYNDTRVADRLAEIDTQTQAMEATIQENEAKAREALEQAGVSTNLASEAQRLADEAKQAHASLSQEVNAAKADLVQKGEQLVQIQSQYTTIEQWKQATDPKLNQIVSDAQNLLNQVNTLDGRLDTVEPVLDELGRQIGTKLTQADLSGYVTSTQLTAKAGELTQEISRVQGLIPTEVGGRNYLLGTRHFTGTTWKNKENWAVESTGEWTTLTRIGPWHGLTQRIPVKVGEVWTFSGYVSKPVAGEVRIYMTDPAESNTVDRWSETFQEIKDEVRLSHTVKVLQDGFLESRFENPISDKMNVSRLKLEKHGILTDYLEALEDYPTYAVVNEIKSTAEANTAKISDTQGNLNSITQTVNGLTTDMVSVKDYVSKDGQRTTTYNQYVETKTAQALSTMRSEVSQGYVGKATLESTVSGINQTFSEIRGQIPTENGGTNLIIGSMTRTPIPNQGASLTFTPGQAVTEWRATDAIRVRGTKGTDNIFASLSVGRANNTSIMNQKYVHSVFIKNLGSPFQVTNNRGQVVDVVTNETKRVVMTGVGNNASNLQINFQQPGTGQLDFYYWHPQIEVGTIVNDWSQAPEDGDLNITTKIAEYKQTVDGQFANLSTQYAGKTEFAKVQTTASLAEQIFGSTNKDGALTNIAREVLAKDIFQTEIKRLETNADLLARVGDGVSVVSDPDFANGLNGVQVYDNSSSGRVTITREQNADGGIGQPTNTSSSRLKITHTGTALPNLGGVKLNPQSTYYSPNKSVVVEISALLPLGYSLNLHSNGVGTGGAVKWLTSNTGTGKWERYVGLYQLGTGTINPYALTFISVSGPTPTTTSPLIWYIQRFDIKDISNSSSQALSTKVTQLAGSWAVQNLDSRDKVLSELNLNSGGVKIAGKLINLDGTVTMNSAFAKKLMVDTFSTNDMTAFMGKFGSIIANNLDVNNLSGNKATLLQALFQSANANIRISGDGIESWRNSGERGMVLDSIGMKVVGTYNQTAGYFSYTKSTTQNNYSRDAIGINVKYKYDLMLGYEGSYVYSDNNLYHIGLHMDGRTGDIGIEKNLTLGGKLNGVNIQSGAGRVSFLTDAGSGIEIEYGRLYVVYGGERKQIT